MPAPRRPPYRSIWTRGDDRNGRAADQRVSVPPALRASREDRRSEYAHDPAGTRTDDRSVVDADDQLHFLRGLPRLLLRRAPAVAVLYLAAEVGLFYARGNSVSAAWSESSLLPEAGPSDPLISALVLAMLVGLGGAIFVKVVATRYRRWRLARTALKAVAMISFLALVGVFVATNLLTVERGRPDIVNAEYAVVLLIGGVLVYDGMLRTETLFRHLGDRSLRRVWNPERYSDFRKSLTGSLDWYTRWPGGALAAVVASVWFVAAVFGQALPPIQDGTTSTYVIVLAAVERTFLFGTRATILLVAINFLILVRYVSALTDRAADGPTLRYHPFHPDELAGFRDLGKFATRVNVLLIIGGLYAVYRITVFDITDLLWGVGPLVAYALVTVVWFYLSFWKLHLRMVEGIRLWLSAGGNPSTRRSVGRFSARADWDSIQEAPRWPITNRRLVELLSANLIPLLLGVAGILQRMGVLG